MSIFTYENSRYRAGWSRPFGELCTRLKHENGEKINGVACCYGLTNEMTDDYEKVCMNCKHWLIWNWS
jgi:hypothetical protein